MRRPGAAIYPDEIGAAVAGQTESDSWHRTTNVRIKKFVMMSGYTEKAVRKKIERGDWLEGYEYHRSTNGEITIYIPGYERWARGLPRVAED